LMSFMEIGASALSYVFYEFINIPRPAFMPGVGSFNSIAPQETKNYKEDIERLHRTLTCNGRAYPGIAEFVVVPQSIFAIPPACNVVFPSQIVSMSLGYDYASEITRNRYQPKGMFLPFDKTYVGPNKIAEGDGGYFGDFSQPKSDLRTVVLGAYIKNDTEFSKYETEYGVNHTEINTLNSAYDSLARKLPPRVAASPNDAVGNKTDDTKAESKEDTNHGDMALSVVCKLLNYEFVKKYLGGRNLSIQVDSSVDAVPGYGLLILSDSGTHIMARCMGYAKTWSANGHYAVTLQVAYPRYYYEDITNIGAVQDFIMDNEERLKISMELIGSAAIMSINEFKSHADQMKIVDDIYKNNKLPDPLKKERTVTEFRQFVAFHNDGNDKGSPSKSEFYGLDSYKGIKVSPELKDRSDPPRDGATSAADSKGEGISDLLDLMDSSLAAPYLSTSMFRVKGKQQPPMKNSEIIRMHNEAIKFAQKL